jgi:hypothetical protein
MLRGSDHVRNVTPAGTPSAAPRTNGQSFRQSSADRVSLHDQAEGHDQTRALQRGQDVKPQRRGNEAKCKAEEAGNDGTGESCQQEQRNFEG